MDKEVKKEAADWLNVLYDKQLSFRTPEEQKIIKKFIPDLSGSAIVMAFVARIIIDSFPGIKKEKKTVFTCKCGSKFGTTQALLKHIEECQEV